MHQGYKHPSKKKKEKKLGLPWKKPQEKKKFEKSTYEFQNLFQKRENFHGKKPGFDLGDLFGEKSIWKGKSGITTRFPHKEALDKSLLEATKKRHPLSNFLKDVEGGETGLEGRAIMQIYDELSKDRLKPQVVPLRNRIQYHNTYSNPEEFIPDFVKRIGGRTLEQGHSQEKIDSGKAYKERYINKRWSDDLLERRQLTDEGWSDWKPRADFHRLPIRRYETTDEEGNEVSWNDMQDVKKAQKGTLASEIHVSPGDIPALIEELGHFAYYQDMSMMDAVENSKYQNELRKEHGSSASSRKIYDVEDSDEWMTHSMITPQLHHRYESLMKMYKDLETKPLEIRR